MSAKTSTTTTTPVQIGTKGTVGSLIMQEIEYFSRLGLGSSSGESKSARRNPHDHHHQLTNTTGTGSSAIPKNGSSSGKKKKKSSSSRFITNMCRGVEVAESKQPKSLSGFAYRNLKAEITTSQV